MDKQAALPDYLFEVSWEVCNKVGGIYTVIATKALFLKAQLKRHHILVGPDVWMHTGDNPEFTERPDLYRQWREQAAAEGLRLRIGKWNVPGKPVAILVDYKQFLTDTDRILAEAWEKYGVDSITGNWDYKESVLFGYVAGKVIESFYRHNLLPSDKVVAQFHEWQTGAGVLYLKTTGLPVASVFTTHATVVGRCLCGNNQPLYDAAPAYDADEKARQYGVTALHSLEKTAARHADIFTTVSDITAGECARFLGREPDVVTPNGFEPSFTPDSEDAWTALRKTARARLAAVAGAMSGTGAGDDDVFIGISGRYEYRNKGIDVFLDAMDRFARSGWQGRPVHAFILVPGGHNGPDKMLADKLSGGGDPAYVTQVSHVLRDPEWDAVSRRLHELKLDNAPSSRLKVYFIPSYLNGNDGIFNLSYYDLLAGLDLTLFPSYYEPWGYTPLESLAFRVPTLTTTLAGFGRWVLDHTEGTRPGIAVVPRGDGNYDSVVDAVVERVREIASLDADGRSAFGADAQKVSEIALWENQIQYYTRAYGEALGKVVERCGAFPEFSKDPSLKYHKMPVNTPSWKSVLVTRHLPAALSGLEILSKNLWWCWNEHAKALFKTIDPEIWHNTMHNPMALLDMVSLKRFNQLAKDQKFLDALADVMEEFNAYMAEKAVRKDPSVAYFCMEYGLDTSLKIYSGGLGILAGDYLKETSDMNVNLTAFGLLYRYGYFTQVLSAQGNQVAKYDAQDFLKIPAEPVMDASGNWMTTSVAFPGRTLYARLWKVAVGRTDLYLLDTDYEANIPEDRQITYHLYGGDWENRLKQEMLLGFGGIRALRQLGISAQIYHCNEGHAAFIGLERLREYIENDNLDFSEAMELVRASSLFTTHTPVPAGHDSFDEGLLRKYLGHYPDRLKADWETLMGLGKVKAEDPGEKFSMSILAANLSQNVNGVSMLHGKVSQNIFAPMYPGYLPEELHISYVTNGVHYPTWTAKEWKAVHAKVFGPEFQTHHYDKKCFDGIYRISDEEIWNVKKTLKHTLVSVVRERLSDTSLGSHYSPSEIVTIKERLREDVLTIGFARRFATYKRATLLFGDLDRLDALVNDPRHPVQFIFAGKAHPADGAGQDLIRRIVEISKQDRFLGRIIFLPGYDITLAKRLVQGVDVWMNNPTRPLEASGTSGEKAAMNGVMHFSVLDGWWVEGYRKDAGWALPIESAYEDHAYQNELDAASEYAIIENEIAPAYYDDRDRQGIPPKWVEFIRNTVAAVASNFTTNRMLTDYLNQYYLPQYARTASLVENDYALAREIALWKKNIRRGWDRIEVISQTQPDSSYSLTEANKMDVEVVLSLGDLRPEDIGLELLLATTDSKGAFHIQERVEYTVADYSDGVARYTASILPERTGMYQVASRMFPRNPLLPHRQDFSLVRWL